jgi:hypothetical protein
MKRFILIALFLCVAASAQASKVVTPSPSGSGVYVELDGDGIDNIDFYGTENRITHPATGEGKYGYYTKGGVPYFLSDTYYGVLWQYISLHSVLISQLSLFPFNPIAEVGGFPLGYTLYINSITNPDAIKEIQGSATRVQSDGTVTAGNLIMLGSSVGGDIAWDNIASYMRNDATTFDWTPNGASTTLTLQSEGYLQQIAENVGSGVVSEYLRLEDLGPVSFIDIIVKQEGSITGDAGVGAGQGLVVFQNFDNPSITNTIQVGSSLTNLITSVLSQNGNTPTPGNYTTYWDGPTKDDGPYSQRMKIEGDGFWTLEYLDGGDVKPLAVIDELALYVDGGAGDFYYAKIDPPTGYLQTTVLLETKSLAGASAGETFTNDTYGIYIYWEN